MNGHPRPASRPIPELTAALEAGELTATELVGDCLDRIEDQNERLHAFLAIDGDGARSAAAASDERRARGRSRGPLDGIPYALKDNIVTRGLPTTCGSRILENFVPPYESTVAARLSDAGAVLVGKTNLDEFAMGSSNEHSAFGVARNPWDESRVPGGSSGGSCVAVAAGLVPLAFGSETGGSVRLPASYCGVVGVKPTYGRVSRYGLVAFGSSLDQIGPVTRDAAGAAAALAAVAGHDPCDATSSDAPVADWGGVLAQNDGAVEGLTVGVIRDFLGDGVDAGVRERVDAAVMDLGRRGARIVEVELPNLRYAVAAYYVVSSAEASANLARFDGAHYGRRAANVSDLEEMYTRSRSEGFGDEVKRRIMIGTFALSAGYYDAYYGRAMRARRLIRRDYERAFESADVLVSPVAPTPAFPLGERTEDPLAMYLTDAMTIPANLAGVPAMSLPAGDVDGLPVGLQLQAPHFREDQLFRVAAAHEQATGPAPVPA